MPKCHKIYPNCIWQVPTELHTLGFYSALLIKSIGIMLPIMYERALHRFCRRPPSWTLMIKVIFKFLSALKQWLVCTIFFATNLLPLRTHFYTNYSLIFQHVFTLISLITLPTNTPRIKDQFIQLIHQFLHSILMVRPTFPK